MFDLLGIMLYHGWVVDPSSEVAPVISDLSYNQLTNNIFAWREEAVKNNNNDLLVKGEKKRVVCFCSLYLLLYLNILMHLSICMYGSCCCAVVTQVTRDQECLQAHGFKSFLLSDFGLFWVILGYGSPPA